MKKRNFQKKVERNRRESQKYRVLIKDVEGSEHKKIAYIYQNRKVVYEQEYDDRKVKPVIEYIEKSGLFWTIALKDDDIYKEGLQMGGMIYTGRKKKKYDKE